MEKNLTVAFHIGRGGRFHNPGHKTYRSHIRTLSACFNDAFIVNEDTDGNPLPDELWTLRDDAGNVLLSGRASIESPVGMIDRDGEYDTDVVKYLQDCDESELESLYEAYLAEDAWMDDGIKEYVCRHKALKRIRDIDFSLMYEATIHCTDGTRLTFEWDGSYNLAEEDAREWMQENNIDPVSIERWADRFEKYFCIE